MRYTVPTLEVLQTMGMWHRSVGTVGWVGCGDLGGVSNL